MKNRGWLLFPIVPLLVVLSLLLDPLINSPDTPLKRFAELVGILGEGWLNLAVAVLLYGLGYVKRDAGLKECGRKGVFALIVAGVGVQLMKVAFQRPRPHFQDTPITELLLDPFLFDTTARFASFPSGHATTVFALAYVVARFYPSLRYSAFGIATVVGISRVIEGAHYPSDVVAGAILGITAAWLVCEGWKSKERLATAGVLFLAIFVSFFKLGGLLLFDFDETVFAEATREMLLTGDIITPYYNFEPRYDKPILIYYLMGLSFLIGGITEFAARAPSAVFGVALVMMLFFFVHRVRGLKQAVFSACALAVSLEFFVYSHSAVTDMTLAFFITASLLSFYLAAEEGVRWGATGFWVMSALAVLTKGAIGMVFPFIIVIIYLFSTKNTGFLKSLFRPLNILLFFLITLPWFSAILYVRGWEFVDAFIIKHHIKRYTGTISGHSGPFYYYLVVLLVGFFPWVAFLPAALRKAWQELRDEGRGLMVFSGVWFLFVVVFFSFSGTKLPNYIFPSFPAAAILTGTVLSEERLKGSFRALTAGAVIAGIIVAALPSFIKIEGEPQFPAYYFYVLGGMIALVGLFSALGQRQRELAFGSMLLVVLSTIVFIRVYVMPPVNVYMQLELYQYARFSKELKEPHRLVTYSLNYPSVVFYSQRQIIKTGRKTREALKELARREPIVVITRKKSLPELEDIKELKLLKKGKRFAVLVNFDIGDNKNEFIAPSEPKKKG